MMVRFIDLCDSECLAALLRDVRPRYVFHLAAAVSDNWEELHRHNVHATHVLLQCLREQAPAARVVVPGSAAEYGLVPKERLPLTEDHPTAPVTLYGVSKVSQTVMARYFAMTGLSVVVGRLFNLTGHGVSARSAIGAFRDQIRSIAHGRQPAVLKTGNLNPRRDFIDVRDACRAFLALAEHGRSGEIYHVCSGQSVAMRWMVERLVATSQARVQVEVDESRIRHVDLPDIYGSREKIGRELGWRPLVSLEDSVRDTLAAP